MIWFILLALFVQRIHVFHSVWLELGSTFHMLQQIFDPNSWISP